MSRIAVILAGGMGTRLRPLTDVLPKPLIPIAGRAIIDYIIEWLKLNGFTKFIVVAKYLGERIVDYFKYSSEVKVKLLDSKDTADAVRLIAGEISEEHFLVSMGDVLCNADFKSFYEYHVENESIATIALKEVDNPLPYGLILTDGDGRIILFTEKPKSIELLILNTAHLKLRSKSLYSNLVNAGFYMFNWDIVRVLEENNGLMDFGRHVFPYLLEEGYRINGWIMSGAYWEDVGRVDSLKKVTWDLLDGGITGYRPLGEEHSPGVYVGKRARIDGIVIPPVYIGEEAVIEYGAIVGPYASLEKGSIVKTRARVSHSILWMNSLVGEDSTIHDSIIMNDVVIRGGVKVVHSIVGSFNTVSANLSEEVVKPKGG
ncbi:MAG: NDP-sugar synthase [Desulfurococcaceae archaeon]